MEEAKNLVPRSWVSSTRVQKIARLSRTRPQIPRKEKVPVLCTAFAGEMCPRNSRTCPARQIVLRPFVPYAFWGSRIGFFQACIAIQGRTRRMRTTAPAPAL